MRQIDKLYHAIIYLLHLTIADTLMAKSFISSENILGLSIIRKRKCDEKKGFKGIN